MAASIVIRIVLLLLSSLGFYFTWHLYLNNGTYDRMVRVRDVGPRVLPGTTAPLRTVYTGIGWIDYQLTVLCLFFWELVDGSQPNASLLCFHFAGQIAAGYGLLMIERSRSGHKGRIISFLMIWALAMQNFVMALISPLYLFVHVSTSPTTRSTDPGLFFVKTVDIASIMISLILTYILPSILVALPTPSILSFNQKQIILAIWQMFPVWAELLYQGASLLLSKVLSQENALTITGRRNTAWMGALRSLYIFLISIAGLTHIATMTLVATSKWFPHLFAIEYRGVFNPSKVFWPVAASTSIKLPSLISGTTLLLQYDEIISSLAILLWALFLFARVMSQKKKFETPYIFIFDFITLTALLGPLGYAAICVWARDELIFEDQKEREANGLEQMSLLDPIQVTEPSPPKGMIETTEPE